MIDIYRDKGRNMERDRIIIYIYRKREREVKRRNTKETKKGI